MHGYVMVIGFDFFFNFRTITKSCIEQAFCIIKFTITALKEKSKFNMHEKKQPNNAWWCFFC
jgi:hypothetical protein